MSDSIGQKNHLFIQFFSAKRQKNEVGDENVESCFLHFQNHPILQ